MNRTRAYIFLQLSVLLFGASGLFAKIISFSTITIVWGRVFFAAAFLLLFLKRKNISLIVSWKKHQLQFMLLGITLSLHWVSFFYAIKISTVALGLITFATFPLFVLLLEPLLLKERFKWTFIPIILIGFLGIIVIVSGWKIDDGNVAIGTLCGLFSGFSFAFLTILNKKISHQISSLEITFFQDSFAAVLLTPLLLFTSEILSVIDVALLIILGIFFTAIAHWLFIESLRGISTITASMATNLEPVYGTILAVIFLNEVPSNLFISGAILVIIAAFWATVLEKKLSSCSDELG